jgi:hypothetical protein
MNLLPNIFLANQYVRHSRIFVNNKLISSTNYYVKNKDTIRIGLNFWTKYYEILLYKIKYKQLRAPYPGYMLVNYKILIGYFLFTPKSFKDIYYPYIVKYNLIKHFCKKL